MREKLRHFDSRGNRNQAVYGRIETIGQGNQRRINQDKSPRDDPELGNGLQEFTEIQDRYGNYGKS